MPRANARLDQIVALALKGLLTGEIADELLLMGSQAARVVMLATNRRLLDIERMHADASAHGPHTPSGSIPPYLKPKAGASDAADTTAHSPTSIPTPKLKPGGQKGHAGSRRASPVEVTREVVIPAQELCPTCKGPLNPPMTGRSRTRNYEDIPKSIDVETIKATIPRQYCPCCKKEVEPPVVDVLPRAMIGHRLCAVSAWLHYGMGISLAHVRGILKGPLSFSLSEGGLIDIWHRLADILEPWHLEIREKAKQCAVLHADETGWRVNGSTHWLWCFAGSDVCSYQIDAHRSIEAVLKFFTQEFEGTLVTDFYRVYDHVLAGDRQYCIPHVLRDLKEGDKTNTSAPWKTFSSTCMKLLKEALNLRKQPDFEVQKYKDQSWELEQRLMRLVEPEYNEDQETHALAARLRRTQDHIFTFLFKAEVPPDNNHAERMIRPAVVMRKISQSNKSDRGAKTQERLMSIFATLKLRGYDDPSRILVESLREYVRTDTLPALPEKLAAGG